MTEPLYVFPLINGNVLSSSAGRVLRNLFTQFRTFMDDLSIKLVRLFELEGNGSGKNATGSIVYI